MSRPDLVAPPGAPHFLVSPSTSLGPAGVAAPPIPEHEAAARCLVRLDELTERLEAAMAAPTDAPAGRAAVYAIGIKHSPSSAYRTITSSRTDNLASAFGEEVLMAVASAAIDALERLEGTVVEGEVRCSELDRARFCVAVTGFRDEGSVMALAEAFAERLTQPIVVKGVHVRLHAEIGLASRAGSHVKSARELLACAETALLCAVHIGDHAPQVYGATMDQWRAEREELERDLVGGLRRGEFVVYYQTRNLTKTREVTGMEALLRWNHPKFGSVSPTKFIPIAEQGGAIGLLGDFVLRSALTQLCSWDAAGYRSLRVGVNLSAAQFRDSSLFEKMAASIRETGIAPHRLELELTEGILMRDPKAAMQTLQRFRDMGVHISIDDFGTGYSSLSYLRRFPVNAMKIDQSFIRQVTNNAQDAAITTAIIVLGRSLDLTVVAEGVETESQFSFLKVLECDEVQGYLFGRPAPPAEAVTTVAKLS